MLERPDGQGMPDFTVAGLRENAAEIAALIAASRHRPNPQVLVRYVVRAIYRELRGAGLQPEELIDVAHIILSEICQDFARENATAAEAEEAQLQDDYRAEFERTLSDPAYAATREPEGGDEASG